MRFKKFSGQILLEILIAVALFSLAAFSVAPVLTDVINVVIDGMEKQKAVYLGIEGLEAIRAIIRENFDKLESGDYFLKVSNWSWELSKEIQRENGFLRQINIKEHENLEEIKKVKIKVEKSEKILFDILQYFGKTKNFALELSSSSYLIGQPNPWQGLAYTILFWVKPKNLFQAEGAGLFANQDTSQSPQGSNYLQIEFDGASNYQIRIGENTFLIGPTLNKWDQLAITWNGTNLNTYYNGEESVSQILPPEEGKTDFKNYLLGVSSDKTKSFEGVYKNLMIFERALTQEEIFDLFSGKLPSLEGLKLYWKINEGEGNLVEDFGPFNVSGEITGQPLWRKILTLSSWKQVADF
jgi:hypothetical protein